MRLDPLLQRKAFNTVIGIYQKFDKLHGTQLLKDFFTNLREGNFKAFGVMRDYLF